MTPCEKLGYKVGDKFRLERDTAAEMRESEELVITLLKDDGTNCPQFSGFTEFDDSSDINLFLDLDEVYKLDYDIQVGDVVVVARMVKSNDPNGMGLGEKWDNQWYYKMDAYIDKQFTISIIDSYGARFENDVKYGFPLTSLKLIGRDNIRQNIANSAEPEKIVETKTEEPLPNLVDVFKKFASDLGSGYDTALFLTKDGHLVKYGLDFDCYEWKGTEAEIIDKINLLRQLHITN